LSGGGSFPPETGPGTGGADDWSNRVMGANNHRQASGPSLRSREVLFAIGFYCLFLGLAVISTYTRGPGLLRQVIWDPVTLYAHYPGDRVSIDSLGEGYFPLWDNHRGIGVPHVSTVGATFDFPLKLMTYALDSDAGYEFYYLLRFLLAGLFCFLSARAVPIGFKGSLFAGLAYMLCGFFREYSNMESMNVELLYPLLMFFIIRLSRRPAIASFVGAIVVGHWLICNPESAVYALAYCFLLFAFATLAGAPGAKGIGGTLLSAAIIPAAVFAGVSILRSDNYLQFFDYYHRSWMFHPEGLGSLTFPLGNSIALVTPIFDYWLPSSVNLDFENLEQLNLIPAYLGAVPFVLALTALAGARRLPVRGLYFAAMAIVFTGMIFGVAPFNLILKLPLARDFQNFRYAQPYLAHATALLAGMGLELILRDAKARKIAAAIAAVVALWIAFHLFGFRERVFAVEIIRYGTMAAAAISIAVAGLYLLSARLFPRRKKALLAAAITAGAGLELALYFNLAAPVFGPSAFNIDKPPVVDFIKSRGQGDGLFRVAGLDQQVLRPNLAELHGLSDVRDHTPLSVKRFADFMAAANGFATRREMISGFLEDGKFYFDVEWNKWPPELLDLINVRYVLSRHPPGSRPIATGLDSMAVTTEGVWFVAPIVAEISGVSRKSLLTHAPATARVELSGADRGAAGGEAGVMEHAAGCEGADGLYLVMALEGDGGTRLGFARFFHAERDRGWTRFGFSTGESDRAVRWSSLPGPLGDRRCDYGVWSEPVIVDPGAPSISDHGLEQVYDREVRVYENKDVLPRVFSPERLARAASDSEMIAALGRADPSLTAWIVGESALDTGEYSPARISDVREGKSLMEFTADGEGESVVVVSSLYYPGWRAWSNGREVKVHRVNSIMRGVVLAPGENRVVTRFVPLTMRMGVWVHVSSLAVAVMVLVVGAARRRRGRAGTGD